MNCKPGDLAVVVRDQRSGSAKTAGKIVEVLYAAPGQPFNMPDGFRHAASPAGAWWVVRFMHQLLVPTIRGERMSAYAVVPDLVLRPIRDPGEDATDEMIVLLGKPVREGETV